MSRPRQRATPGCSGSGIVAGDPMGYAESWHKADKALRSLARFMERHAGYYIGIDGGTLFALRDGERYEWRLPKAYRRKR